MGLRRIHLHGSLQELHQGVIELQADTVAEAINGLCKLLRIQVNAVTGRRRIKVLGFNSDASLVEKSDTVDLHLLPALAGGKSGFLQIVFGVVLIIIGLVLDYFSWGTAGNQFIAMGISMVIQGVITLIAPQKKPQGDVGYLGAPVNTTRIGTPIPLIIGECMVFGQVLSYDVDAVGT